MKLFINIAIALMFTNQACATIISVVGPLSSNGVAAVIIPAPTFALDGSVTNLGQEGFDEMQGVLLPGALLVDSGSIAAGTLVDSHMIFLNNPTGVATTHASVLWTFSGAVLGVMSDSTGSLEVSSTALLGAPGTAYPGAIFAARGMEGNDGYVIGGNTLTVSMFVSQPGDWIRVITAVPEPATLAFLSLGLAMLGFGRRRKIAC